jgi:hypothetical protein
VIVEGVGALLLMTMAGAPQAEAPKPQSPSRAQPGGVLLRKQIIIRSVRIRPVASGSPATILWREARGPKCLPVRSIAGATLLGRNSVDFILRDRSRIRARLDSACPALDYYSGFYLTPGSDGLVCADRDFLRSRMGRECGIDRFRLLRVRQRR